MVLSSVAAAASWLRWSHRAGLSSAKLLCLFAIAANSVPIIAFAPIMNNWFGITNPASKMAIGGNHRFLPYHDQYGTRAHLGRRQPIGIDARLRFKTCPYHVQAAHSQCLAVHIQRLACCQRLEFDRGGRGGVFWRATGYAGSLYHAGSVGIRFRQGMDRHRHGVRDRHYILSGGLAIGATFDALACVVPGSGVVASAQQKLVTFNS